MLFIDNPFNDIYFNLAAEEYLLKNFTEDIFMIWQSEPCVVVGKHQNLKVEVNLDFAHENQIKIARRFSGGGTVYQDMGNINLTFIEESEHPDFNKFADKMVSVLASIGVESVADERRALFIDGNKISGSAQFLHKNKVLYHATLLYSTDLIMLEKAVFLLKELSVIKAENIAKPDLAIVEDIIPIKPNQTNIEVEQTAKPEPVITETGQAFKPNLSEFEFTEIISETKPWRYVKSVKSPVTNISDHFDKTLSVSEFRELLLKAFLALSSAGKRPLVYQFSDKDILKINQLRDEKYSKEYWISKGMLSLF